jgi:hypothetical protein
MTGEPEMGKFPATEHQKADISVGKKKGGGGNSQQSERSTRRGHIWPPASEVTKDG